ncbi:tropomyosin isoform X3 [Ceratitis capitata]|nr:tropomyosin isoform X3 [Ceratitis capitata]
MVKHTAAQPNTLQPAERSEIEKVFVSSQNIQNALQTFINRHRSILQNLLEQNQKLEQQNSMLNVQLSNQQGNILALNERIITVGNEIEKYKEEQTRLLENKNLLRTELLAYKKRCGELMISGENEKIELQAVIEKQKNELKMRDERENKLNVELDVIRRELQAKQNECDKADIELTKGKMELSQNKECLEALQKSLNNLKDELKQRDEIIDKLHKEQADYKAETDKTINKMREIQHIFYPNASNLLPPVPRSSNESRNAQPVAISVQPRPQSRAALKRTSSSSSSDSDSDNDAALLVRGWVPVRKSTGTQIQDENRRGSTDIPPTSESGGEPSTRKRARR